MLRKDLKRQNEDGIPFLDGDWEEMDTTYSQLGIDYEPIYAYFWKQNPDIRELITESRLHLHKIVDTAHKEGIYIPYIGLISQFIFR